MPTALQGGGRHCVRQREKTAEQASAGVGGVGTAPETTTQRVCFKSGLLQASFSFLTYEEGLGSLAHSGETLSGRRGAGIWGVNEMAQVRSLFLTHSPKFALGKKLL